MRMVGREAAGSLPAQRLDRQNDQGRPDDHNPRQLARAGVWAVEPEGQGIGGYHPRELAGEAIQGDAEGVLLGVEVDPRPKEVERPVELSDQHRGSGEGRRN
jgi:hypothetical protein